MPSITGTFGLASHTISKRLRELRFVWRSGRRQAGLRPRSPMLSCWPAVCWDASVAASRVLSAIVYQASAQDPLVLGAAAFTLLPTGSLSVAGPVRRALHIDPANLLREE